MSFRRFVRLLDLPTGLVKPDDADAKIKFLAAEALRGVGGLVLNKEGYRFANDLGRRDALEGKSSQISKLLQFEF